MAFAGRYIFSLPFLMMVLPLIKTKAGFTLLQILRIWGLLRVLKNYGRYNFGSSSQNLNTQTVSLEEAYKILNLDPKKKYSKEQIMNAYKKRSEKVNEYLRKPTHKKYKAASTVCYAVNNKRDIMKRLRNVFLKSYNNFSETFYQSEKKYSLDCMWYPLQEKYKWYFIEDKIGYHINTKSDINYIIK